MSVKIKEAKSKDSGKERTITFKTKDSMVIEGTKNSKFLKPGENKVVNKIQGERMIAAGKAKEVKGVVIEDVVNPHRQVTASAKEFPNKK